MEPTGEPGNPAGVQQPPAQPAASQAEVYAQPSGGIFFIIKCIWLFVLGAILAIVGLLCLVYRPDMGANSFIIMLMGLFFTAAGSIYGKRKMTGQAAAADYVVDPAQMLQVKPADAIPQPQQPPQQMQQFPSYPAYPSYPQPVQAPREPARPAQPAQPAAPASEAQPAGIRKIFVCPKCGAENEMEDQFCYKCGTKFVKPKKKAAKARKPAKKPVKQAKAAEKVTLKAVKASGQKKKIPKAEV